MPKKSHHSTSRDANPYLADVADIDTLIEREKRRGDPYGYLDMLLDDRAERMAKRDLWWRMWDKVNDGKPDA